MTHDSATKTDSLISSFNDTEKVVRFAKQTE
jgi:hypothetical protein